LGDFVWANVGKYSSTMEHLGYLAPGQTALAPGDPKRRCRAPRCFFLKGGLVDVSIVFMGYEWKYMEISMGYNGY